MAQRTVSIAGNPIDASVSGANEPVKLDELVNKVEEEEEANGGGRTAIAAAGA